MPHLHAVAVVPTIVVTAPAIVAVAAAVVDELLALPVIAVIRSTIDGSVWKPDETIRDRFWTFGSVDWVTADDLAALAPFERLA